MLYTNEAKKLRNAYTYFVISFYYQKRKFMCSNILLNVFIVYIEKKMFYIRH